MAINSFIPVIWSARLLSNLHKAQVFGNENIINRDYEGDISQMGDTVKITSIGAVTVGDYSKNTDIGSPQTLNDAQSILTIDQSKYFNFQIDDVDKAQGNPRVMNEAMQEAAYAVSNVADQFIASKYTDISAANTIGSDATPQLLDTTTTVGNNAYERLVDLSVTLDQNDVPEDGRWVIVPPVMEGLLLKDTRFVSFGTGQNLARVMNGSLDGGATSGTPGKGAIGSVAGFTVYKSNNVSSLVNGSSQTVYQIIAGHKMGWSFADQVNEVQAYRPEKRFADAVKGLHLYGAKVVRPNTLALLKARFA